MTRLTYLGSLLAFGFMASVAACSSDDDNKSNNGDIGALNASCYPNGTCLAGLRCASGKCISDGLLDTDGGGQTQPGGPRFLAFSTDVKRIYNDESVTFTAVLTDTDGVDDIIGGTLKAGDASFGAFATSGQEGSYQMTVTWDAINKVKPISFAMRTEDTRTFSAEFYDTAGHIAKADFTLTLHCKGLAACNGVCVDNDRHEGKCPELTACTKIPINGAATTCEQVCAGKSQKCYEGCDPNGASGSAAGFYTTASGTNSPDCTNPTSYISSCKSQMGGNTTYAYGFRCCCG